MYSGSQLEVEVTATNKFTGSESTAQLTVFLRDEDVPILKRVMGLVGALILGSLFLFIILGSQKLYQKVQSDKEKKELKRYIRVITRLYQQKLKRADTVKYPFRIKGSEIQLTDFATTDDKRTSVPTKTYETETL